MPRKKRETIVIILLISIILTLNKNSNVEATSKEENNVEIQNQNNDNNLENQPSSQQLKVETKSEQQEIDEHVTNKLKQYFIQQNSPSPSDSSPETNDQKQPQQHQCNKNDKNCQKKIKGQIQQESQSQQQLEQEQQQQPSSSNNNNNNNNNNEELEPEQQQSEEDDSSTSNYKQNQYKFIDIFYRMNTDLKKFNSGNEHLFAPTYLHSRIFSSWKIFVPHRKIICLKRRNSLQKILELPTHSQLDFAAQAIECQIYSDELTDFVSSQFPFRGFVRLANETNGYYQIKPDRLVLHLFTKESLRPTVHEHFCQKWIFDVECMKAQTVLENFQEQDLPSVTQCESVCRNRLDPTVHHLLCHPCSLQEYHDILAAELEVDHNSFAFLFQFSLWERLAPVLYNTQLPLELLYFVFCVILMKHYNSDAAIQQQNQRQQLLELQERARKAGNEADQRKIDQYLQMQNQHSIIGQSQFIIMNILVFVYLRFALFDYGSFLGYGFSFYVSWRTSRVTTIFVYAFYVLVHIFKQLAPFEPTAALAHFLAHFFSVWFVLLVLLILFGKFPCKAFISFTLIKVYTKLIAFMAELCKYIPNQSRLPFNLLQLIYIFPDQELHSWEKTKARVWTILISYKILDFPYRFEIGVALGVFVYVSVTIIAYYCGRHCVNQNIVKGRFKRWFISMCAFSFSPIQILIATVKTTLGDMNNRISYNHYFNTSIYFVLHSFYYPDITYYLMGLSLFILPWFFKIVKDKSIDVDMDTKVFQTVWISFHILKTKVFGNSRPLIMKKKNKVKKIGADTAESTHKKKK